MVLLVEIIELHDHPWFLGCQFHPEFKSRPMNPHPLFREFIRASLKYSQESLSGKNPIERDTNRQLEGWRDHPASGHCRALCHRRRIDYRSHRPANFMRSENRLNIPLVFKASYDKANRTSIHSFRGPGLEAGLDLLDFIRTRFELPVLSDVHQVSEIEKAAQVLDVIQIPAFLCRQTDLLTAAGRNGPAGQC